MPRCWISASLRRLMDHEQGQSTFSVADAGGLAGTIEYMAPERLRGAPGDERGDIWSLGVVLYEMAARSLPFSGETAYALSAAILERPALPLPASVPPALGRIIERCLEKDPARRYHSAGEVAAGLEMRRARSAPARSAGRSRVSAGTRSRTASLAIVLAVFLLQSPTARTKRGMRRAPSSR